MNKSKFLKMLSYLPEVSFLLTAVFWFLDNYLGASHVNYFMIAIAAIILILIVSRSVILAVAISILLGFGSLYMILAVVSEYSEFPSGDPEGTKLLLIGLSIFTTLIAMAVIMPIKYFKTT